MIQVLRIIFSDIFKVFKDFFRWNLYKLLLIIPVFVFGILLFVNVRNAGLSVDFDSLSTLVFSYDLVGVFLLIVSISTFSIVSIVATLLLLFGYSIAKVVLVSMNVSYIKGKKIKLTGNIKKRVLKLLQSSFLFFKITLLHIGILMLPVLLFIVCSYGLITLQGGSGAALEVVSGNPSNYISIGLLILFIVTVLVLCVAYYRIMFSYLGALKGGLKKKKTALGYVKESYSLTKGYKKGLLFLGLLFVYFLIVFVPINIGYKILSYKAQEYSYYAIYQNATHEEQQQLEAYQPYYFEGLVAKFSGISENEIKSSYMRSQYIMFALVLFKFFFLFGIYSMVVTSFYKRVLTA